MENSMINFLWTGSVERVKEVYYSGLVKMHICLKKEANELKLRLNSFTYFESTKRDLYRYFSCLDH